MGTGKKGKEGTLDHPTTDTLQSQSKYIKTRKKAHLIDPEVDKILEARLGPQRKNLPDARSIYGWS